MDSWLFPLAFLTKTPQERRSRVLQAAATAIVPIPEAQRSAFAVVAADQQVRSADQRQEQAVSDSISAVHTVLTKPNGARRITDGELAGLPSLKSVLDRDGVGPQLRARLDGVGGLLEGDEATLANEATAIIVKALQQPKDQKLTVADLDGYLGQLILRQPELKEQIVDTGGTP